MRKFALFFFLSFPALTFAARTSSVSSSSGTSSGGSTSPGGVNTQIQYNNNGVFGGSEFSQFGSSTSVGFDPFDIFQATSAGGPQRNDAIFYSSFSQTAKYQFLLFKLPTNEGGPYVSQPYVTIYASTYSVVGDIPPINTSPLPRIHLTPPGTGASEGIINLLVGVNGINLTGSAVYLGRSDIQAINFSGYDASTYTAGGCLSVDSSNHVYLNNFPASSGSSIYGATNTIIATYGIATASLTSLSGSGSINIYNNGSPGWGFNFIDSFGGLAGGFSLGSTQFGISFTSGTTGSTNVPRFSINKTTPQIILKDQANNTLAEFNIPVSTINSTINTPYGITAATATFSSSMTLSGGKLVQNVVPTINQVLGFDGTNWTPTNASGMTSGASYYVNVQTTTMQTGGLNISTGIFSTVNITTETITSSATFRGGLSASNLTSTRVVFSSAGGRLTDASGFTYSSGLSALTVPTINATNAVLTNISFGSMNGAVLSGVYTPTASAATNLDATPNLTAAQYMQVGNVVTVSGRFTANPTLAATTTSFEISLPLTTGFDTDYRLGGVAFCGSIAGMGAEIDASTASTLNALVTWKSTDINSQSWSYTLTYLIQPAI